MHLNTNTDWLDHPIFDVMVTFHAADQRLHLEFQGLRPLRTWTESAEFKIIAEFSANCRGTLSLRQEYSTECFSETDAILLQELIMSALNELVKQMHYKDIIKKLRLIKISSGKRGCRNNSLIECDGKVVQIFGCDIAVLLFYIPVFFSMSRYIGPLVCNESFFSK